VSAPARVLCLLASGLLAAGAAAAQPSGDRRGAGREEGFRMVEAYVVSNLQPSLGLTDEQFVKALPLVKKLMSDRREGIDRRRRTLRELRDALESGTATEAGIADRLKAVKALEAEEADRNRKNLDALDSALTPLQQAKFRVMELEIERRIRELMADIRMRRRGGPRP
jgi:Spy/CpxP family protein refolding chaperone